MNERITLNMLTLGPLRPGRPGIPGGPRDPEAPSGPGGPGRPGYKHVHVITPRLKGRLTGPNEIPPGSPF